jgi:hypothetical protein
MKPGHLLVANGAAIIALGFVAGLIFGEWPEVIAIQAIAVACGAACITSAIGMGADARNQFRLQVGMKRADLGSQKTQVSPTTATPAQEGFHG